MRALIVGTVFFAQVACASVQNTDEIVRKNFAQLTKPLSSKKAHFQSVLVGVVTPFETKIIPIGSLDRSGKLPDQLTIYEIGSITKGLVGLLLAESAISGKVDLDGPFSDETGIKLPEFKGETIGWSHLAQHTSGLPRVPDNLSPSDPLQPYENYNMAKLKTFLNSFQLKSKPGSKFGYSNLGAGLVGLGLEKIYGGSLESQLVNHIFNQFHMNDSRIFLSSEQHSRMTPVFLNDEQIVPWAWKEESALQAAGALKSTMQDMIFLMKVMMGLMAQDYYPVVDAATKPRFDSGKNSQLGLFWHRLKSENIVWHNGGTYGSSGFFGYDPDSLVGVIALSNSNIIDENGVDPRIDLASIKSILEVRESLRMDKVVEIFRTYDSEILKREAKFKEFTGGETSREWVGHKIKHMFDLDQYMRALVMDIPKYRLSPEEIEFFNVGYMRRFFMMDWSNTRDFKKLYKRYGWFKISEWGEEVDNKAWLLVQHADHDVEFQKEILGRLKPLCKNGETRPVNCAYLYDRLAVAENRPQKYGTQGQCVGPGKWEPFTLEDPSSVDKRRAGVGLSTLEEYISGFADICH